MHQVDLRNTTLSLCPEYEALSYEWSPYESAKGVIVMKEGKSSRQISGLLYST
jgi:hypothetical protein